jgi:hypothetical protein
VSLQKDPHAQARAAGHESSTPPRSSTFTDTAMADDLVITVDTSVRIWSARWAGRRGYSLRRLLAMASRSATTVPGDPTARLFRQPAVGVGQRHRDVALALADRDRADDAMRNPDRQPGGGDGRQGPCARKSIRASRFREDPRPNRMWEVSVDARGADALSRFTLASCWAAQQSSNGFPTTDRPRATPGWRASVPSSGRRGSGCLCWR